jgi:hypothetical protein
MATELRSISVKLQNPHAARILEAPLVGFVAFLFLSAAALMVAIRRSASFSATIPWIVLSLFFSLALAVLVTLPTWRNRQAHEINWSFLALTFLFASATGMLTSSINRSDLDDSVYVPKAVYYMENPSAILNYDISWIYGIYPTPKSVVFQYYETMQAVLSSVLNVDLLFVYHIVFPFIDGFTMFLAIFLSISLFDNRKWLILVSTAFVIVVILSLGDTHRTYGNITIARGFQGKFVFIAMGVPSWIYFSLRFLSQQNLYNWIVLFAMGIAMTALTTTAIVFLPSLSLLLAISFVTSTMSVLLIYKYAGYIGAYFCSLIPIAMIALNFRAYAVAHISSSSFSNSGFPASFQDQLGFIVDSPYSTTLIIFVIALIIISIKSTYRIFFLCWVTSAFVLFLNPFVSNFIIKNITTQNIYWRLFYLLPIPLLVGLALLTLINKGPVSKILVGGLFCLMMGLAICGPGRVIRPSNNATLGSPSYKINPATLAVVNSIREYVKPGSMFAPLEISSNILMLTAKYPQFHVRDDYLGFVMLDAGQGDELEDRTLAYKYLYLADRDTKAAAAFQRIISSDAAPASVVLYKSSANFEEIAATLRQHGYSEAAVADDRYIVFQYVNT